MNELVLSNIVGFLLGIIASLFAWWILFHAIVPKIIFSPSISKSPIEDNKSGWRYKFKIINAGYRTIIDLEVMARLRVKGIGAIPENWQNMYIPIGYDASKYYRFPELYANIDRVISIYINNQSDFKTWQFYPEDIIKKANDENLLLEDVLAMGNEATLQIFIFGNDGLSGARKLFKSKLYNINDIKEGTFEPKGLEIKEQTD